MSSYFLSSLQYVLYATKYRNGNSIITLFTGSPILAGHKDEEAVIEGIHLVLYESKPTNEQKPEFDYPREFPDFVQPKMDELDTGTLVAILGLSEDWNDDAEYVIASNFFYAILHEGLSVNIHQYGQANQINF